MRVIAGTAKGRPLKAPRGQTTRPTSDLLRGAIFSMLASMGVQPGRVLDLYAGSGALGIEALSRGAEYGDFVEQSSVACAIIRQNLAYAGFAERSRVLCLPVARASRRLGGPYDLIFADPPYADRAARDAMNQVVSLVCAEDALFVYEHSRQDEPPARFGALELLRTRSHGGSSVSFYAASDATSDEAGGMPIHGSELGTEAQQ